MIASLGLAVSLLSQDSTPLNARMAAEVALVSMAPGKAEPVLIPIAPTPAKPRNRTVRVLILAFSSDSLVMDGERAALRLKNSSPGFQVTLPAGIDVGDVRLVRLKPKDGRRGLGHSSSLEHPFNKDDVMAIKPELIDPARPNVLRVVTTAALAPGEYALLVDFRFFDFGIN